MAIFACSLSVYLPALRNEFVWDDITYIVENPWIRSLRVQSLAQMFFSFRAGNWHPLTWVSHAIDYRLWGDNPAGHRTGNLILHALNASLVFLLSYLLMARAEAANRKGFSRPISTRKYYAGKHALEIQINGTKYGAIDFDLV